MLEQKLTPFSFTPSELVELLYDLIYFSKQVNTGMTDFLTKVVASNQQGKSESFPQVRADLMKTTELLSGVFNLKSPALIC